MSRRDGDRGRAGEDRPGDPAAVGGRRAVAEAIHAGSAVEVLVAKGAKTSQGLHDVLEAAAEAGVAVREAPRVELDALAEDHRGVVARVGRASPTLGERDLVSFPFPDDAIVVVLDGIMDPQNLGAAARSAEAAGVSLVLTRTRRSADVTPAAIRASAGALLHLPHARVPNLVRAMEHLKDSGFTVVGLDGEAPSSIDGVGCPSGRVALVIGSEGTGMARLTRERCDLLVRLPMHGKVSSLNAAASLAAALYAWVLPR
jgi:23S rRNA (guanosine2251-2'-O)-methyltransferase